ncbi:MAG: PQQ-dependent sugar dehydrogenase, partial [Candidatus Korarchaeota archaeon]|nr:PQQ-dependent sugar dehydrogenase [Candidatus Korarchaeota archaeon]
VDLEKKGGGEDEEVSSSSQRSILSGLGRLRNVAEGPDEHLYILTSNTDGKGFPDSQDDKLLRIAK